VLDNAKIHKTRDNMDLLTNKYNFLFLAPYSAPMMPIELGNMPFPLSLLSFRILKEESLSGSSQ
jgi:hypothetical protein